MKRSIQKGIEPVQMPLSIVAQKIEKFIDATHAMGGVPELNITNRGLFDVMKFDYISLYVE
ncbi:MAG: hypothetical protein GYA51_09370 [Candidatus Methanofastidiosa archaeon]|nr:hypothetical protein [Candidatus Methanofastidiosa archaeon]